jgi:hypothetical protein
VAELTTVGKRSLQCGEVLFQIQRKKAWQYFTQMFFKNPESKGRIRKLQPYYMHTSKSNKRKRKRKVTTRRQHPTRHNNNPCFFKSLEIFHFSSENMTNFVEEIRQNFNVTKLKKEKRKLWQQWNETSQS